VKHSQAAAADVHCADFSHAVMAALMQTSCDKGWRSPHFERGFPVEKISSAHPGS